MLSDLLVSCMLCNKNMLEMSKKSQKLLSLTSEYEEENEFFNWETSLNSGNFSVVVHLMLTLSNAFIFAEPGKF